MSEVGPVEQSTQDVSNTQYDELKEFLTQIDCVIENCGKDLKNIGEEYYEMKKTVGMQLQTVAEFFPGSHSYIVENLISKSDSSLSYFYLDLLESNFAIFENLDTTVGEVLTKLKYEDLILKNPGSFSEDHRTSTVQKALFDWEKNQRINKPLKVRGSEILMPNINIFGEEDKMLLLKDIIDLGDGDVVAKGINTLRDVSQQDIVDYMIISRKEKGFEDLANFIGINFESVLDELIKSEQVSATLEEVVENFDGEKIERIVQYVREGDTKVADDELVSLMEEFDEFPALQQRIISRLTEEALDSEGKKEHSLYTDFLVRNIHIFVQKGHRLSSLGMFNPSQIETIVNCMLDEHEACNVSVEEIFDAMIYLNNDDLPHFTGDTAIKMIELERKSGRTGERIFRRRSIWEHSALPVIAGKFEELGEYEILARHLADFKLKNEEFLELEEKLNQLGHGAEAFRSMYEVLAEERQDRERLVKRYIQKGYFPAIVENLKIIGEHTLDEDVFMKLQEAGYTLEQLTNNLKPFRGIDAKNIEGFANLNKDMSRTVLHNFKSFSRLTGEILKRSVDSILPEYENPLYNEYSGDMARNIIQVMDSGRFEGEKLDPTVVSFLIQKSGGSEPFIKNITGYLDYIEDIEKLLDVVIQRDFISVKPFDKSYIITRILRQSKGLSPRCAQKLEESGFGEQVKQNRESFITD